MAFPEEQIQYMALDKIVCDPQVRTQFDEEALVGLAQSIKEIGIQLPIRVRRDSSGSFIVVDGERRHRAAIKAGLTQVPVIVDERELSVSDVMQRQLILNCQRQDLSPLETAMALAQLIKETGWSASKTAAKLGFSNATVSRLLSLIALPAAIREKVASGAIPASTAYELSHVTDTNLQAELARRVVAGELTRDGIRRQTVGGSGAMSGTKRRSHKTKAGSRFTASVTRGLSVTVNASAVDLDGLIQWLDGLVAKAREAKPKGVDVVTFLKTVKGPAKA